MARKHRDWVTAYLRYTEHSEAPDIFRKWTAIATIAGALRRRVWLNMGTFSWYPNFYICLVAPPGVAGKSTTADVGISLLRQVPGINFGPNVATWQALVTSLTESREDYPLPDGEFVPMCAITISSAELGNFLRPEDQEMVTLLTDLYDCREDVFKKVTKGGGDEIIVNHWINLIGCTTPAWIASNWGRYFIGGGFSSRMIFLFADHKRQLIAYPRRANGVEPGLRQSLIDDLTEIAEIQGEFELTEEAYIWGTAWYENHNAGDNPLRLDPRTQGYWSRKQMHMHKTAMVLSAARRDTRVITLEDLRDAERYLQEVEPDMLAVFGEMNHELVADQMALVLEAIRSRGPLAKTTLYRLFVNRLGFETFNECLDGLIAAGLARLISDADGVKIHFSGADVVERVQQTAYPGHPAPETTPAVPVLQQMPDPQPQAGTSESMSA